MRQIEFKDKLGRRYLVRDWGGKRWLFREVNGEWVSLRELTPGQEAEYERIADNRMRQA
jgi:hypothetical protein